MASLTRIAFIAFSIALPAFSAPALESGIDLAGMDKSVRPGDSFDQYANGAWVKATEIPPDKSSYGPFAILADKTRTQIADLIQQSVGSSQASAESKKVGAFHAAFMDETAIETKGIAPLQARLDAIAGINDRLQLARVLGANLRADVDPLNATSFETENLFGVWISQGLADPKNYYPYLLQGGLGLPDRDYYVSAAPKMAELRPLYLAHVEAMLNLAHQLDANARAARIFALETKMAEVHATRTESADVTQAVTWKREELPEKAPGLDWPALLEAASLKDATALYIWHPKAIAGLSKLAASEPLDAWKDWLTFHAIEHAAPFLPKAFIEEQFNFAGKTLTGAQEMQPRWQRGIDFTGGALEDAVSKLYVERYFPLKSKAKIQSLVRDLQNAFGKRIDQLTWMSPATKAKARQKLRTLIVGVGYPNRWQDISGLEIKNDDALGNAQRAELFRYRRQLAKLHKSVDRDEWWMPAHVINAVNLPLQNALNFPAAILQPPYFDPNADAAHNYGAIGAIIGHEISHSFDDQGSLFDSQGRLANWWTKEDMDHFNAAGEALAKQFDQYRPFPDLAVNGHQTLSENIADLAGLATAYDAYQLSQSRNPAPVIDGLTGDQRFFISYAQAWRNKTREARLRKQIATDGHAPAQYRSATVRNLDPWYAAFRVAPNQKMYLAPTERLHVW